MSEKGGRESELPMMILNNQMDIKMEQNMQVIGNLTAQTPQVTKRLDNFSSTFYWGVECHTGEHEVFKMSC